MSGNETRNSVNVWRCRPSALIYPCFVTAFVLAVAIFLAVLAFGTWSGTGQGLAIVFMIQSVLAIAVAVYVGIHMLYLVRVRICVEPHHIVLTCARNRRFPIPQTIILSPDEIASVEVRQEVIRYVAAGTTQVINREMGEVITRQGETLLFADVKRGVLPVAEIAATIAETARVPLVNNGP